MALSCQVTLRHMDPPILQEPFQHHQSRDTVLPEQGTLVTSSRSAAFLLTLLQVASQPSTGRRILLETGNTKTRTT